MPHSGGGGSHGGGFHSGGSHHSSSSHSSQQTYGVSRNYYVGAHRYVYYHKGRCHSYYSKEIPTNNKSANIFAYIIISIFIFVGIFILSLSVREPKKINNNTTLSSNIIDTNNVFNDKDNVLNVINEFSEKTGLIVYLEMIEYHDRVNEYYTLEDCAYDKYVSTFGTNEKFLYIMYEYNELQSSYWAFETMYGDDTNSLFVGNMEDKFTKSIDTNLRMSSSVDEAFINIFSDTSFMDRKYVDSFMIVFGVFWTGFSLLCLFGVIYDQKKKSLMAKDSVEVKDIKEEPEKCRYCGCEYFISTVSECPHCGAGIIYKNE